jgi:magnesium-dependent phosphatase 1
MTLSPHLFVFDLDFTLWDAAGTWCDCTTPPYQRVNNHVEDFNGAEIVLYADVVQALNRLKKAGKLLAVASRTTAPVIARNLLDLFEIRHLFDYEEIYPTSKILHFRAINEQSGIAFDKMVFFDDEHRNIVNVKSLGVETVHVTNGLNSRHISKYL